MKRIMLASLLFMTMAVCSRAQEEEERVYMSSCSLSVKATVLPPGEQDTVGKALIEVTLTDKTGIPITEQKITLISSCGAFFTTQMEKGDYSSPKQSEYSCFTIGDDGKRQLYLIGIPFNKQGRIKASCVYGDLEVHASCTFSVSRKVIKKRK